MGFPKTALQIFVEKKFQDELTQYLAVTDGLFVAVAVLILCLTAIRVEPSRAISPAVKTAWLAGSHYWVNLLALLLTLILIVSIAHAQALLTWPLAQFGGCNTARAGSHLAFVCGMVGQMVTAYGVLATIVLGSIMLPGVELLRVRCQALAMEVTQADPNADPEAWLQGKKLTMSAWDVAGRLIIVLAPLVSGLVIPYVSGIAFAKALALAFPTHNVRWGALVGGKRRGKAGRFSQDPRNRSG